MNGDDRDQHGRSKRADARMSMIESALALGLALASLGRTSNSSTTEPASDGAETVDPIVDSKDQYSFFVKLYDEESAREKQLNDNGKNNLSLVAVYSAFVIFVTEKMRPENLYLKGLFVGVIAFMLAAFFLTLRLLAIKKYEAITLPATVIDAYKEKPTSSNFFDDRIADIFVATERNTIVNNNKARQLYIAGYLILVGIGLHGIFFAAQILNLFPPSVQTNTTAQSISSSKPNQKTP